MEETSQKTIDIQPISKGKRMLVFLADFFLVFIFSFVFFNALVMPIGNYVTHYSERNKESGDAAKSQYDILYGEKVMHYENSKDIYKYNSNVEFTRDCYLSYYAFEDSDVLKDHPKFGHKEENEVIMHYFNDIKDNKSYYLFVLQSFNAKYDYFAIEDQSFSLKSEVKTNIRLSFFSPSDMSKDGKTMLSNLQSFFLDTYAEVFKDIEKNDLVHNGSSYLANKKIVDDLENYYQWQLVISSGIAYLLSIALYFLLLPLLNENHRTLAMMMMKKTRIGTNSLYILDKVENVTNSVFMLAFNLPVIFFMPMTCVAFSYLFNIPALLAILFVGIILILASLIFVLASPYNKTLSDFMLRSVIITNDDLDEIYRAKGYDI